MKKWLILAAISLPFVTDVLVDSQFRQQHAETGYSHEEADALDRLVDRVNGDGTAKRRHKILSGSDDQAALHLLWGPE